MEFIFSIYFLISSGLLYNLSCSCCFSLLLLSLFSHLRLISFHILSITYAEDLGALFTASMPMFLMTFTFPKVSFTLLWVAFLLKWDKEIVHKLTKPIRATWTNHGYDMTFCHFFPLLVFDALRRAYSELPICSKKSCREQLKSFWRGGAVASEVCFQTFSTSIIWFIFHSFFIFIQYSLSFSLMLDGWTIPGAPLHAFEHHCKLFVDHASASQIYGKKNSAKYWQICWVMLKDCFCIIEF